MHYINSQYIIAIFSPRIILVDHFKQSFSGRIELSPLILAIASFFLYFWLKILFSLWFVFCFLFCSPFTFWTSWLFGGVIASWKYYPFMKEWKRNWCRMYAVAVVLQFFHKMRLFFNINNNKTPTKDWSNPQLYSLQLPTFLHPQRTQYQCLITATKEEEDGGSID